jgi:hypothetical protein
MAVLSTARADRLVDVWTGAERGPDGAPVVTVAWTPRLGAGRSDSAPQARSLVERTVAVAVKGAGGDRSFDAAFDAGVLSFPSPPGAVQLQVSVRDAAGNILDEERRPFTVPDPSSAGLAIASPVVLRARTVADARAIAGGGQALPFAGTEFNRTDRVYVRFSVYGAAAGEAQVSARLTNKAGASLLELPVARTSGAGYQLEVPLASIARGDYLIAVAAAHGEERTRALVPLRVLSF